MDTTIEWTRVNNDTYGNPRYVCHFHDLLTAEEMALPYWQENGQRTPKYAMACKRANKLGGRKFHNKQYGGGIVFQSYNIHDTEQYILKATGKLSEGEK